MELGHVGAIFPCMSMRPLVWGGVVFGKRRGDGWISVQNSEELDHLTFEPSLPMLGPFEEHKRAKFLCWRLGYLVGTSCPAWAGGVRRNRSA